MENENGSLCLGARLRKTLAEIKLEVRPECKLVSNDHLGLVWKFLNPGLNVALKSDTF